MNLKTNPEFLPIVEWWEKDGKSTVIWAVVIAIAVGGWYGWKSHRASVKADSSAALVETFTTEEIEDAVAAYSGEKSEGALKLKLAKNYFDSGKYEEAMALYEELDGNAPEGFADIPVVGKAQCLEALGKFAEAQAAFDKFAEANGKSYLALTAQLGAARCIAEAGDKTKALARIDAIKAANKGEEISLARIEATEKCIRRFEAAK